MILNGPHINDIDVDNTDRRKALILVMRVNSGFTLVELIMVILLIGVLAVYAAPKFDVSIFEQNSFFIQAMSSIRYAQKQAIASGCNVEVDINASACNLEWSNPAPANANCPIDAVPINNPANSNANFCAGSTPDASPTGGNFRFDNIGRPMNTSDVVLTAVKEIVISTQTIQVEAETGYTHEK